LIFTLRKDGGPDVRPRFLEDPGRQPAGVFGFCGGGDGKCEALSVLGIYVPTASESQSCRRLALARSG